MKVIHPDGSTKIYPLQQLTKLYDGINQLEDDLYEGSDGDSQGSYDEREEWAMNKDGVWRPIRNDERDAWDDEEDEDLEIEDGHDGSIPDAPSTHPMHSDHEMAPTEELATPRSPSDSRIIPPTEAESSPSDTQSRPLHDSDQVRDPDEDNPSWKRFDILPSAPPDHAYYGTVASQPSKSFLARLNREYRILQSSLPSTSLDFLPSIES